jgi:hypothetical protein
VNADMRDVRVPFPLSLLFFFYHWHFLCQIAPKTQGARGLDDLDARLLLVVQYLYA